MILNMACFYLILGACGILVHSLRKRPERSKLNYISGVIFAGGWVMFPVGALAELGGQIAYMPVFGLICAVMFILMVRRGLEHIQLGIDQSDYPYDHPRP